MDDARAMAQQQMMLQRQQHQQQQQQHQHQQQILLMQQIQRQKQQDAISRFPSNIDAHLRPPHLLHRQINSNQPSQPQSLSNNPNSGANTNPNPNPTHQIQNQQAAANSNATPGLNPQQQQHLQQQQQQHLQQQQQKAARGANQAEIQMAYQDAWRVCHPDFKRPFSSLEDACERLLPYHVVADYEAEEDDKILESDTTGQMLSRSQQWDHNIAAKVAEFTATFEKQVLAFNIISRKRDLGEFRTEEKLMMEQYLMQDEKRAMFELRAEIESRQKQGRETGEPSWRMASMHAEQAGGEAHADMRTPIRASALASQGSNLSMSQDMSEQEQEINPEEVMNGWGNNTQKDEKEPSEDFLNDEETENGDMGTQSEWRGGGELDLNSR